MNWDEMSARERDALVAEKVMGWHLTGELMFGEHPQGFPPNPYTSIQIGVPHYTTNIGEAWEVVDTFQKRPHDDVYHSFYDKATMSIYAITPERICLAALRAMGVEI